MSRADEERGKEKRIIRSQIPRRVPTPDLGHEEQKQEPGSDAQQRRHRPDRLTRFGMRTTAPEPPCGDDRNQCEQRHAQSERRGLFGDRASHGSELFERSEVRTELRLQKSISNLIVSLRQWKNRREEIVNEHHISISDDSPKWRLRLKVLALGPTGPRTGAS